MIGRSGHGLGQELDRSVVICLTVVVAILLLTGLALAVGTNPASAAAHPRPGVPKSAHP